MSQAILLTRVSTGVFRFAVLILLASCFVANPFRMTAQEAAPASNDAPAASTAPPPGSEEAAVEAGDNAFRHSEVIKAVAKALHLSKETTARGFEIINIAVVVFGIGIPLYRFLPKYLRNRSEKLSGDIEAARKQTEDANSRLKAVESKLAHLDEEIAKFRSDLKAEMEQDEARIKAAIEEERERVVAQAEQEIGKAAAQAKRGLRHFAAELAIEQASNQLVLTPETDRALIAEFVSNAGKGGTN